MSGKRPVVVDLFCGAGGESQGIHWAMGDDIQLFAVNHWQRACETHAKNFPGDECVCQDIQTIIPTDLIKDRTVELMWASPECTNFSVAKGGRPLDDQSRCTPFDILRWLTMLDVKRLIVENVKEFVTWGPLNKDDRPIPERKGEFFGMFVNAIRALGYAVEWRFCNAADFGAPTTRTRFFLQAVRKGKKIVWPEPKYGRTPSRGTLFEDNRLPWIPASQIIDWSLPCTPIDDREKPLAEATMRRILRGIEKFWGDGAKPFLCRYNGGDNRSHSLDEPVPVLDTSNRYGLVQPMLLPQQSGGALKPVSEPSPTIAMAGAIGFVQPLITTFNFQNACRQVDQPLPTVTTVGHHGLIQPLIAELRGKSGCRPVSDPLSTVSCSGGHHALVMEYYGNGVCHNPESDPLPVVTTKERFALIESSEKVRLGFRMLQPHELAAAQSFPKDYKFTGNKTDVVKQIGNAVCPKMAQALVEAV